MAEFAITAAVLFFLVFGLYDMAIAVSLYNSVSYGAREGARYAIAHPEGSANAATTDTVTNVVKGVSPELNPAHLTVNLTWPTTAEVATSPKGIDAEVDVSYVFTFDVPFIAPSVTLSSSSRMYVGDTP